MEENRSFAQALRRRSSCWQKALKIDETRQPSFHSSNEREENLSLANRKILLFFFGEKWSNKIVKAIESRPGSEKKRDNGIVLLARRDISPDIFRQMSKVFVGQFWIGNCKQRRSVSKLLRTDHFPTGLKKIYVDFCWRLPSIIELYMTSDRFSVVERCVSLGEDLSIWLKNV